MVVAAGVIVLAARAGEACPVRAPFAALSVDSPCAEERRACWTEFPVRFEARSFGYTLQECDLAVWSFGDGTMASVRGSGEVTHSYALPGNYRVRLEIQNLMGRAEMREHRVAISDFPSYITMDNERRVIPESNTTIDVFVQRTGDISEKVTVDYEVYGAVTAQAYGTLVFPPDVLEQKIGIAIFDDELFGGEPLNWVFVRLLRPTGGTVLKTQFFHIQVSDDEPQAVLSAPSEMVVSENDGVVRIPVRTSWPIAADLAFGYSVIDRTAKASSDFLLPSDPFFNNNPTRFGHATLAAGQTTAYLEIPLVDDAVPEAAESFEVTMYDFPQGIPAGPMHTVVIIRDDEGGRRRAVR